MLRKGNLFKAKLIEAIDRNHWIVSFQGQLFQVRNSSDIEFKEGLLLTLMVEKEKPLELRVYGPAVRARKSLNLIA